jgi:UDP-N-acetylmuramate dehydrogenase
MAKVSFRELNKLLPGLQRNVSLKNYTTFRIGGPAQYFFIAKKKENIIKAIKTARKLKIPFFILGEGSNLLVSDKGFKGLIIQFRNSKFEIRNSSLYAEAGVLVSVLVKKTIQQGWGGLEWAAGLPGTLGGAIRGNAGAFGREMKDVIFEVEFLDKKLNLKKLSKKRCNFSYRSSIFKKNNLIILSATLKLKKGNKRIIQSIAKSHIKYRKERHPLSYPSAGSIFKNVDFKKIPKKIKNKFSQVIKKDPFPVVPAAYLIFEAGLKGQRVGQAQISKKQPNYIVNLGKARAKDIIKLINLVKKRVKNKFGITLEEEVQMIPPRF